MQIKGNYLSVGTGIGTEMISCLQLLARKPNASESRIFSQHA